MGNKVYDRKGYTVRAKILINQNIKFLDNRIKSEIFNLQKEGCEIESVSPITQIGSELSCVITYKDFHQPDEIYRYY